MRCGRCRSRLRQQEHHGLHGQKGKPSDPFCFSVQSVTCPSNSCDQYYSSRRTLLLAAGTRSLVAGVAITALLSPGTWQGQVWLTGRVSDLFIWRRVRRRHNAARRGAHLRALRRLTGGGSGIVGGRQCRAYRAGREQCRKTEKLQGSGHHTLRSGARYESWNARLDGAMHQITTIGLLHFFMQNAEGWRPSGLKARRCCR